MGIDDTGYMELALVEARAAGDCGEVPVGAVLVAGDGSVLARGGNRQITALDPTAHAEVRVLRAAAMQTGNYRLPGTTLYVTLEPCTMCCGAIVHARIGRVVFAAREPKAGAVVSTAALLDRTAANHRVEWSEGIGAATSKDILQAFFAARRGARRRAVQQSQ